MSVTATHHLWESYPDYANDTSVWPHFPLLRTYQIVASGTLIEMQAAHDVAEDANHDPDVVFHIRATGEHPANVPAYYRSREAD